MAFELSFTNEFFYGDGFSDVTCASERPLSVWQALESMTDEDWKEACEAVGFNPDTISIDDMMAKVRETNTCTDIKSPVEVWIDSEGYHRIEVFEKLRRYTMVGSYPLFYVTLRDGALCYKCASHERYTTPEVNWESELYCDECSEKIESAYGEE